MSTATDLVKIDKKDGVTIITPLGDRRLFIRLRMENGDVFPSEDGQLLEKLSPFTIKIKKGVKLTFEVREGRGSWAEGVLE